LQTWARGDDHARETKDELGAVDFDVATNSQGLEVKRFTVKTLSRDASHVSVVATPRRTTGCVNRSARTRSDTTLSGSVGDGRSTTSIP
jgi:hypothetical protein